MTPKITSASEFEQVTMFPDLSSPVARDEKSGQTKTESISLRSECVLERVPVFATMPRFAAHHLITIP
jgi:hypothetical protein